MTAGPGGETAPLGRCHLRTSHADREQVVDALKAAFVQGRLAKDEFDARISQTLASRTYADLTAITADIPPGPAAINARPTAVQPPLPPAQVLTWAEKATAWGLYSIVMTVIFTIAVVPAPTTIEAAAVTAAVIYFVFWLLGGLIAIAARHGWLRPCVDRRNPARPPTQQRGGRP